MRVLFFFFALIHFALTAMFLSARPVWFPGGIVPPLLLALSIGLVVASARVSTHLSFARRLGLTCLSFVWLGYAVWLYQLFFGSYLVAGSGPGANPMAGVILLFGIFLLFLFGFTTRLIFWLARYQPEDSKPRPRLSDVAGTPWARDASHTATHKL